MDKKLFSYFLENNWQIENDFEKALKSFKFKDFTDAFSWMTSLSLIIENNDHHPEWKNVYNKLEVVLTTHDTGGLSEKDIILAKAMDEEFKKYI